MLQRLNLETGSLMPVGQPADATHCHSFLDDSDGALWLCSNTGLWRKNANGWARVTTGVLQQPPWPMRIHQTSDGQMWVIQEEVGRRDRLLRVVEGRLAPFAAPGFPTDLNVSRFLEDHEGNLWIGSTEGLFQLRRVKVRVFSARDGLKSDDVHSVTCGPDGTIWVGTGLGFHGLREGQIFDVPRPPSSSAGFWGAVSLADSSNCLWFSTGDRHLTGFRNGNWTRLDAPADLQYGWRNPSALFADRSRRIWIATDRGVACQNEGQWRHYTIKNEGPRVSVRVIHEDRRGDMWFGTYGHGLCRLRDGEMTSFRTLLGDYNNRAWWIHEDADGVFWVGSQNGLNRFVPPGMNPVGNPKSAARNDQSLAPSVATTEGEGRFFTFTTVHGLRENVVNNIQEDDAGHLWLSGLRGIYQVARTELNRVAAGEKPEVHCVAYGEADGMLNSECNGGDYQPAGCKDAQGRIWFPTAKGVAVIDPKQIQRNEIPPPVVIEQVIADEEVVFGDGCSSRLVAAAARRLKANSGKRNPTPEIDQSLLASTAMVRLEPGRARALKIRFTANSFAAPERIRFKYRLEGWEKNWREAERDERMAVYTNLRPGTYWFRVKACNNHGYWSTNDAVIAFSLAPHIWQTWPFYVLCGVAVVGLAAGITAYRLRWQRRLLTARHERALAEERARIARDLHDDLGTALTGVALEIDVARRQSHDGIAARLGESAGHVRALAERMREVVWAVNPCCDTVSSLASFLEQQAGTLLRSGGVHGRFEFPEVIPPLPLNSDTRHQLALGVREALTNVLRHAQASEVVLGVRLREEALVVSVRDNGRGFDPTTVGTEPGHGWHNLRARLARVGGSVNIASQPGAGTRVEFSVPLVRPATPKVTP